MVTVAMKLKDVCSLEEKLKKLKEEVEKLEIEERQRQEREEQKRREMSILKEISPEYSLD